MKSKKVAYIGTYAKERKRLLQINVSANWGSHGRIAEDIGQLAITKGWDSYIAYGRMANPSNSHLIKIGNKCDIVWHGIGSRLSDNHGLASRGATCKLVNVIQSIQPDVIHLHNVHGYYLNYPTLFDFLVQYNRPVVWTLHDCWSFTGHCAYFTYTKCDKWKTGCFDCPNKNNYPASYLLDRSRRNYKLKKEYFNSLNKLTLVPVSEWLYDLLSESFLSDIPRKCIHNGIDLDIFKRNNDLQSICPNQKVVLGVCSVWDFRKGLKDFIELRHWLSENYIIVLIGLTKQQIKELPDGIVGIERTNDVQELAAYYSRADVFVNPTYEDNFPTTNLEALGCGTPVITYKTGGSPEAINQKTGIAIECGDIIALSDAIKRICNSDCRHILRRDCRERAERCFDKVKCYQEYFKLYDSLIGGSTTSI